MNKIIDSFSEAVSDVPDGAILMIDGFAGPGGTPQNLIEALRNHGAKDLTIISNTAGLASVVGFGTLPGETPIDIGILVDNDQIKILVIVAHRLKITEKCSELILFKDGRLSDRGTFQELSERNELFRQMLNT